MARRSERKGITEGLLAVAAKLPCWASLLFALVSFVLLHSIPSQDVGTAASTRDIGAVATRGLYQALADVGQYVVPLIFVVGVLASVLGQRKRRAHQIASLPGRHPAIERDCWRSAYPASDYVCQSSEAAVLLDLRRDDL